MASWPEVLAAKRENRHELILSGDEISKRIEKHGFDHSIAELLSLNLLRISDTCLDNLSDDVSKLVNLQTLLLHSNKLRSLPQTLGQLTKLKMLDLSRNQLTHLPEEIGSLTQLTTLNVSCNKLEKLPSFVNNLKLAVLNLSNNKLASFPDICSAELVHLAEVDLNSNSISEIPVDLKVLPSLKVLNISDNQLMCLPGEMCDIVKLKELNLKNNPIKDRRLLKLIDQCRSKQVLDYIRQNCPRQNTDTNKARNKTTQRITKRQQRRGDRESFTDPTASGEEESDIGAAIMYVARTRETAHPPDITVMENVRAIRGYILCCVLRNVGFDKQVLRRFIQMQTRLHETICGRRNLATIATHDLGRLPPGGLVYSALPPAELKIRPLARADECTGIKLFEQLKAEAEIARKERKRNSYPAVHRYLHLLEGSKLFPCLMDVNQRVISFPPITNSDCTKISEQTVSILVEVTSSASQDVCRSVLDALLKETLLLGIGGDRTLTVERLRIFDPEGTMRAVYPSKPDLNYGNEIKVIREQEKHN